MLITGTNLSMTRGDTERFTVAPTINGIDRPLAVGDTLYFTVKEDTSKKDHVLQKIITSFPDSKAIINIDPADTKQLLGRYVYDVQVTYSGGDVKTHIPPSVFSVTPEVTDE